jgi:ribonucleoside-diphosphate reductase alpha chain
MLHNEGTRKLIDQVRRDKYMQPDEADWEHTLYRVAHAVADGDEVFEDELRSQFSSGRIVPAGRILAGAGTSNQVTWINCFVSCDIKDSLSGAEGIMDALGMAARTMQMGGGIGMAFGTIRPRGAIVRGLNAPASGVLPFMDMWNAMCGTIMSAGSRRGAMMATLPCDHPDLWRPDGSDSFIKAKQTPGRLTNFNVSVLVTDKFMEAVAKGLDWELVHEVPAKDFNTPQRVIDGKYIYFTLPARELWNQILQSTYKYAEPGVIFIDRVNALNPLGRIERITATNPCGEQPLPPYGDCNLSAVNLAKFILNPFSKDSIIQWSDLEKSVQLTVEMLDNIIDLSPFPLEQQRIEAQSKRRIGLGITGLGNALAMLRLRYGSDDAVAMTQKIMQFIAQAAYKKSHELAKIRGAYPAYSPSARYMTFEFHALGISDPISLRNGVILTIAPTGTTSIAQGDNCSSGIEPPFSFTYTRKVLQPDGSFAEHQVEDYSYALYKSMGLPTDDLPSYMVTAQELSVSDHLAIQAACQEYVDSSISKTINCPPEMSFEDFAQVYSKAYSLGLKGCTTYRYDPDAGRGSILSVDSPKPRDTIEVVPAKRDPVLSGKTYKVRWPHQDESLYVTINSSEGRPFEIFINSKSVKHAEWTSALTRLISAVFRKGGDFHFLVEELTQVMSSDGGAWIKVPGGEKPQFIPSVVALIGHVLADYFQIKPEAAREHCPKCYSPDFVSESGCKTCKSCGYSHCG